ncbi:MAG: hypothetical protein ABR559_10490, partial [Gemmatimonadota bacterium]
MRRRPGVMLAVLLGALWQSAPLRAQEVPEGVPVDRLVVDAAASPDERAVPYPTTLAAGDRLAVWINNDVRVGDPSAGRGPVADAAPGEVVARFGASGWFAWPTGPVVWAAPAVGRLAFAINGHAVHRLEGAARLTVAPLGPSGSGRERAFAPPRVTLERVAGGVRVRYADGAGFGLDLRSLAATVTTSHGVVTRMAGWGT